MSGVCVTIDHFRRLRAQLALGPLCAHRQHVKDAETSQNKSQETSWLFVQKLSFGMSLKNLQRNSKRLSEDDTNRYLQTLKTGPALSGFEVACLVLKLMPQNVSIELCELQNLFWHLILMDFLM